MPVRRKPNILAQKKKRLKAINANRRKQMGELGDLANFYIAGIVRRTQRGKAIDGSDFKAYSTAYQKRKAKTNQGAATENLTMTGLMLNSITMKPTADGFKLLFINSLQNKKALGNQKTRPFFGLDKEQKAYLKKYLIKKFKKR